MARQTILTGYTDILDALLRKCITNSSVCLERLQAAGYPGGLTTVKDYIASHKHLVPAKRQLVAPQGSRGRRFTTEPEEAYHGDLPRFWTMTERSTMLPALPWSATTTVSGISSSSPTPNRKTYSLV